MTQPAENHPFAEWVILELKGHWRGAGWLTEATLAGANFLRLDVPGLPTEGGLTQFIEPGSVYRITPTTEAVARGVAYSTPAPVQRWELPAAEKAEPEDFPDDELDRHPF
jgi:hypothetical protein